jgi:hypothetical protein
VSPSEGTHIDVLMSNDPKTEELITDEVCTFPPNVDRLDVAGGLNPGLSEPGN